MSCWPPDSVILLPPERLPIQMFEIAVMAAVAIRAVSFQLLYQYTLLGRKLQVFDRLAVQLTSSLR